MFRTGARCECRSYVSVLVGSMSRTTSQSVLSTDQLEQTEAPRQSFSAMLAVMLICLMVVGTAVLFALHPEVASAQERKWAGQEGGVPFPCAWECALKTIPNPIGPEFMVPPARNIASA